MACSRISCAVVDLPPVTEVLVSKAAGFHHRRVTLGLAAEQPLSLMSTGCIEQRSCFSASDARGAFAFLPLHALLS